MTDPARPRVAILGAGPVGLDAALAAAERGLPFTVYEAGREVADHVRSWAHVRLFSPWDLDVSPRMRRALAAAGIETPAGDRCPTGGELVERVLGPLAELPPIRPRLRLGTRVEAVGREGLLKHEEIGSDRRSARPFRILAVDARGGEAIDAADAVLDCTGSYGNPNALGDGGIPAPGERALSARIVRRIPDVAAQPEAWAGKAILLAGAGHSAQTAARDLARLAREAPGTRVTWALRRARPGWGAVPDDPLPERALLAADAEQLAAGASPAIAAIRGVVVEELAARDGGIEVVLRAADGSRRSVAADRILSLTGFVGDHTIYRQLQVHECYATSGPMKLAAALLGSGSTDCLTQAAPGAAALTNPEPGFFMLGAKSYGRNSSFLMRTGWQQVDEVFALLAGER